MIQYLVEIDLPAILTQEMMETIPEHRAKVSLWMNRGVILSYTLAADRSRLWIMLVGESEADADRVIQSLPLVDYFVDIRIHALMFHDTVVTPITQISLN